MKVVNFSSNSESGLSARSATVNQERPYERTDTEIMHVI